MSKITKEELIERLTKGVSPGFISDEEASHIDADEALLEYIIDDEEITEAFYKRVK